MKVCPVSNFSLSFAMLDQVAASTNANLLSNMLSEQVLVSLEVSQTTKLKENYHEEWTGANKVSNPIVINT